MKNDSGLLSIKIEGESHLLKVYFDRGEVTSISIGTCKNEECLKRLNNVIPIEYSFIKGVPPPTRTGLPLTEKIMELSGIAIAESSPELPSAAQGASIQPQMVADLEEGFVEMIGPIGRIIIDNVFSEISYKRGNPMLAEDYSYLLKTLIEELPVRQQTLFSEKYRKNIEKE